LPSIGESPGLVSLEAMANGCKAVVSDKRFTPVDTYFGNNVTKINPLDIKSIKKGIFEEIKKERNMVKISKNIIDNFSWENTARQTIEAYKILYRK
jgi:glycosyltransferase involved in cell wall biosynthesis